MLLPWVSDSFKPNPKKAKQDEHVCKRSYVTYWRLFLKMRDYVARECRSRECRNANSVHSSSTFLFHVPY